MQPLPNLELGVNAWVRKPENAFLCILWAGYMLKRNWHLVSEVEKWMVTGEEQVEGNEEFVRLTNEQLLNSTWMPSNSVLAVCELLRTGSSDEGEQEAGPSKVKSPPRKKAKKTSQREQLENLEVVECVADAVDMRVDALDVCDEDIDDNDGDGGYDKLVREHLLKLLDMSDQELRQSYKRFLLKRDRMHEDEINCRVHNADMRIEEKEKYREKLCRETTYTDLYTELDCVYDAFLIVQGVSWLSFDISRLLMKYPTLRNIIYTLRQRLNIRLTTRNFL